MTAKDKKIQDLEQENNGLREELRMIVESLKVCRFCKHIDADCTPQSHDCRPEWRGQK